MGIDNAKSSIRLTLNQVKAFLAQEAPPRLSEADTKANFIEPIISALGWIGIGVVTREYYVKNSQEFIDYVMSASAGPLLAIETKALQTELTDKAAAQLIQYCSVEGIEWAALTNGRELQFFNSFLKPDLAAKRVLSLDLLAFNNDEEYDALFQQVWQLSRESMTTPTGVRTWLNQRRLDTALRGILLNPASPTVRQLRKVLADSEINATAQDLVQWFRSHLGTPIAALPRPHQRPGTEPAPSEPKAGTGQPRIPPIPVSIRAFDPSSTEVFAGAHRQLLSVFNALRDAVNQRVPTTIWRSLASYVAAEESGQTFIAIKRRGESLSIGLSLPTDVHAPYLAENTGEFNWARITKVARLTSESDIVEPLLSSIEMAASHAVKSRRASTSYGIALRDLLDAGLLKPGERLILTKGSRDMATAEVSPSGEVMWQDRVYKTLSDRAFAALLGRQSLNGWTSWYVERPNGRELVAEVRARLLTKDAAAEA